MKVRIANELLNMPVGLVRLLGKVLVEPEDKVGFTMYDFTLQPEDDFTFTAIYPDQNHIYYCVEGKCILHKRAAEKMTFTADHVLALTPESKVKLEIQEPMRIVACSVPRDPNMSPVPFLMKNLSQVIDSDRNVFFEHGYSRRFLAAPDGFNISVHNTLCHANLETRLHYQDNVEAVYWIKGQGEYALQDGTQKHEFDPEKHRGTLILLEHDAHEVKIGPADSISICLFFPSA